MTSRALISLSPTVENYLKHLFAQQQLTERRLLPMGKLAAAMGVTHGTATAMVKTLVDYGLVQYEPRDGVCLTATGERHALDVIRRHRLLELFLVQVLGLDWSEVFEWRGAGTIATQPPLGAMWKAEGLFTAIYFGWSQDRLCLRLDPDDAAQPRLNGLGMEITLHGPQHSFRLSCSLAPSGPEAFTLFQQSEAETWQEIGPYRSICRRTVLELAVPIKPSTSSRDKRYA